MMIVGYDRDKRKKGRFWIGVGKFFLRMRLIVEMVVVKFGGGLVRKLMKFCLSDFILFYKMRNVDCGWKREENCVVWE